MSFRAELQIKFAAKQAPLRKAALRK